MKQMNILVTDAHTRTALYVVRSLGSRGHRITAQIERKYDNLSSFGTKSRYVSEKVRTAADPRDEDRYITELSRLARHYDVIVPVKTATIMAVSRHRDLFNGCAYLVPDFESINLLQNKASLYQHASKIGIGIPRTFFPRSVDDVERISREVAYPVIIKLREEGDYDPKDRYEIVHNAGQLLALYRQMHARFPDPLIQEIVEGKSGGFFALYDRESELVASFCHRRIRQYPCQGGPSSCCESMYDSEVVSMGTKLLNSLKWKGLAMVEFIKDEKSGVLRVIDVNPRFWGSTPLAIFSGVDFPYLLLRAALGEKISGRPTYESGVKMRFIVNDFMALMDCMAHGNNRLRYMGRFMRDLFDFRINNGIISLSDFRPSLAYIGALLKKKGP